MCSWRRTYVWESSEDIENFRSSFHHGLAVDFGEELKHFNPFRCSDPREKPLLFSEELTSSC